MEFVSVAEVANELFWAFLAAVVALVVAAFTHLVLLFRRHVPPAALLAGPILLVASLWLTSRFLLVGTSPDDALDVVEPLIQGFGTTFVAGPMFALPTFAVCAIGLALAGPRNRPWDSRAAIVMAGIGLLAAGLVVFGAAAISGNPLFARIRGVSYVLLTVLVAVAGLEASRPVDPNRPVGAAAAASVLLVLWLAIAESAAWGFAFVLIPSTPQTLDPELCRENWPGAIQWMMWKMNGELPWSWAAIVAASAMAVVGAVREYRLRRSVSFVVAAAVSIGLAALLFSSAQLDEAYLVGLVERCPSP